MQPFKSNYRIDYFNGKQFDGDEKYWRLPRQGRWFHKAVTWESATGTAIHYVDGDMTGTYTGMNTGLDISKHEGLLLSLSNYNDGYQDKTLSNVRFNDAVFWMGALDEVRIYRRVVGPVEMSLIGSVNTGFGATAETAGDPSLILHYTFDDAVNGQTPFKVKNFGSGGSKHDLVPTFGAIPFRGIRTGIECAPSVEVTPPIIMEFDDEGIAPIAPNTVLSGVEDGSFDVDIYGLISDLSGSYNKFVITKLPEKGEIFFDTLLSAPTLRGTGVLIVHH